MKQRLLSINYGSSKGGLSTVGYTLYTKAGAVHTARSTAGVVEIGTSTGIYAANVSMDDGFTGIVLWDTGEGTPRYGLEPTQSSLEAIQDETDHIRLIWNSLRNQGDLYAQLLEHLKSLRLGKKGTDPWKPLEERLKKVETGLKDLTKRPDAPSLEEIKAAVTFTVTAPEPVVNLPAPIVNVPPVKLPDYRMELTRITQKIDTLKQTGDQRVLAAANRLESALTVISTKLGTLSSSVEVRGLVRDLMDALATVKRELTVDIKDTTMIDQLLARLESLQSDRKIQKLMHDLGI